MVSSFPGLDAREGDMRAERVAELHRPEPVQFEEAVEVAPAADAGEPRRAVAPAAAAVLCKGHRSKGCTGRHVRSATTFC